MTRFAAVRGDALGNTLRAIRASQPFSAGNLWGAPRRRGLGTMGYLPSALRGLYDQAVYVVWSYGTPIAWLDAEGTWMAPRVRYSPTTDRHQSTVRSALAGHLACREPVPHNLPDYIQTPEPYVFL